MMNKQVNLSEVRFDKTRKELYLNAKLVGGYPREIDVVSNHTGEIVTFRVIGPDDKQFSEDQWDGEMQMYAPVQNCPRVEYMIVSWNYD